MQKKEKRKKGKKRGGGILSGGWKQTVLLSYLVRPGNQGKEEKGKGEELSAGGSPRSFACVPHLLCLHAPHGHCSERGKGEKKGKKKGGGGEKDPWIYLPAGLLFSPSASAIEKKRSRRCSPRSHHYPIRSKRS